MLCPACVKEMAVIEVSDVEIDWCASCGGIWLDEGELELLSGEKDTSNPVNKALKTGQGRTGNKNCPVCAKKMNSTELPVVPPVEVDVCPLRHGIWLDKGELEKIMVCLKNDELGKLISSTFKA
jgi:Zn-finger nucleic acid-binding protein